MSPVKKTFKPSADATSAGRLSRTSFERGIHADLPVTDRAARRSVSLPMYPGLSENDQATVIDAVRTAFARHSVAEELAAR